MIVVRNFFNWCFVLSMMMQLVITQDIWELGFILIKLKSYKIKWFWKYKGKFVVDRGGRTSPSTREAIAGMLSISTMYLNGGGGEGSSSSSHKDRSKKRKHHQTPSPVEQLEEIEKVHQDDDFSKLNWICHKIMYRWRGCNVASNYYLVNELFLRNKFLLKSNSWQIIV